MADQSRRPGDTGDEKVQTGSREKDGFNKEFELKSPMSVDSEAMQDGIIAPIYRGEDDEHFNAPPQTATDLVTEVLHVEDDPSLSPWTFRTWFLGKCMRSRQELKYEMLIAFRPWTFYLWWHSGHYLLLQTTSRRSFHHFPRCH
jgi:hypothetical protein